MDLFFIILVLLSTIAYSIEKKVLKDLTLIEFWVLYTILSFIIAIVVLCITKYVLKHPTNIIEKINCKNGFNWIFYSLVIVVILISISTIFQMKYLKNNDLGIVINNEKPCFNQYCGIVAMIIGVFLLCKNKKN
jgi:drug/metabolite transporter (DMT)-like permease